MSYNTCLSCVVGETHNRHVFNVTMAVIDVTNRSFSTLFASRLHD